jgi:hypothetical protein
MATSAATPKLSDDELVEMLSIMKDSDSVELKLTIPEAAQRSSVLALGMDPLAAQVRLIYFFDTPDLALEGAGVVVRARRTRQGDDSVVKLRPVVPSELADEVRESRFCMVEVDAMPGGFVCSGRLKASTRRGKVKEAVDGARPARSLFNKAQRSFFAEHAPEGIGIDDLSILGPIMVLKLKFRPPGYDRRLVAELWTYPDGSRIAELSTKCAPSEAFQVAAETRVYLEERGIDLSGEQATKTKTALEFFTR